MYRLTIFHKWMHFFKHHPNTHILISLSKIVLFFLPKPDGLLILHGLVMFNWTIHSVAKGETENCPRLFFFTFPKVISSVNNYSLKYLFSSSLSPLLCSKLDLITYYLHHCSYFPDSLSASGLVSLHTILYFAWWVIFPNKMTAWHQTPIIKYFNYFL